MKLNDLKRKDIENAALLIDEQGIPKDNVWSQYYILVNGKEYQFKHILRTAFELATNQKLQFQSNDSYIGYIKDLGFQVIYYREGYNFFTREELEFYSSIVNQDYRTKNDEQKFYGQKLFPINAKLKYWLEQIKPKEFKIRYDGKWLGANSKVSPYLWPRIYQGEDKDIFYNIEVNGSEKFIGYKLDGYFETTKALPEYKIKLVEEYKNLINLEYPQIKFENLNEYNWERLIRESKTYVEKYLSQHDILKKILSKDAKIARITWNSNSWIKPSGRNGKSINDSFEKQYGFGHEEWLFDGDKIVNGFKYGFLEPIHKHRSKYEGQIFDLSLYTRNAETSNNFWVAYLQDEEVIFPNESEKILDHYKKEGWYDEMKSDLRNLSLDSNQLDLWIEEGAQNLFNIKFKASQINEIQNSLIPVSEENEIPSNRYTLMDISIRLQENIEKESKSGFSFETSGSLEAELITKSKRIGQIKELELQLLHNLLQTKFLKYLQKKYGKAIVKRECTAYGASRIDVTRKTDSGYIFYEIKTYNSLKTSIREGIGQLLEYSLYPNIIEAQSIVLVSHVNPTEEVKKYLNHIKNFIKIPFSYIHFDIEKEEIISEI